MSIGPYFGPLTITSVDSAIRTTPGHVIIDLSQSTFVDAYAIVAIACHAAEAYNADLPIRFIPPDHGSVRNYLSRMHLRHLLESVQAAGADSLASVRESDLREVLLPLTLCKGGGYTALADMLWARLERDVDPETLNSMYEGVSELGANVEQHSQTSFGYVAAQTYLVGQPRESVLFSVGDIGIGVRQSLQPLHHPDSDLSAIRLALTEGVSGINEPGRGVGLPTLRDTALAQRGWMSVRSGASLLQIYSATMSTPISIEYQHGTLVGARFLSRPGRR